MPNDALRAEHDAVLTSLSTRESTRHFAHAAVSTLVALMSAGTAAKLWYDFSWPHPEWTWESGGLAAVLFVYGLVRVALGARANAVERKQLLRLRELRTQLGVDAPASTTPKAP